MIDNDLIFKLMLNFPVILILESGGSARSAVILQRFPEKNWEDTPFIEGIEWVRYTYLYFICIFCLSNYLYTDSLVKDYYKSRYHFLVLFFNYFTPLQFI